jgi:hypothetical protein
MTTFPDKDSLKKSLKITLTDANLDALIDEWRLGSISAIERFCGQPIEAKQVTYDFRAQGTRHTPAYFPIRSIVSLSQYSSGWSLIAASSYTLLLGSIEYESGFEANSTYRAVLGVGYTDLPEEIVDIFREMVMIHYKGSEFSQGARLGVSSVTENFAGSSKTLSLRSMTEEWYTKLDKYRVPPV